MMLAKFRHHYPQGSLLSELVKIDRGLFIVKVSIQVQDKILATALASADCVEAAEDQARQRAIAALVLDSENPISPQSVISQSAEPVKSSSTPISSPSSSPSSQTTFTSESKVESISNHTANNNRVNHNNVVDFAEHQTEMPNPHRISEPTFSSPPSVTESPNPLPGIESQVDDQIQLTTDTSNLFGEVLVSETSSKVALNDQRSEGKGDSVSHMPSSFHDGVISDFNDNIGETSSSKINTGDSIKIGEIDFNEIKQKTDIEIKRLGWTKDDGRDFLKSRYGKRSRLHLTDEQLLEFLHYLESLPSPG